MYGKPWKDFSCILFYSLRILCSFPLWTRKLIFQTAHVMDHPIQRFSSTFSSSVSHEARWGENVGGVSSCLYVWVVWIGSGGICTGPRLVFPQEIGLLSSTCIGSRNRSSKVFLGPNIHLKVLCVFETYGPDSFLTGCKLRHIRHPPMTPKCTF